MFSTKDERKKAGNKLVIELAINEFLSSIFIPMFQINQMVNDSISPPDAWYLGKTLCHFEFGNQLSQCEGNQVLGEA